MLFRSAVVRSTRQLSRIKAAEVAEEIQASLATHEHSVPKDLTFKHFAKLFCNFANRQATDGERNANYVKTSIYLLNAKGWGLIDTFGPLNVSEIQTRHWIQYVQKISKDRPDLTASTKNSLQAVFRNVLKQARDQGVIAAVPATPRQRTEDRPRPFLDRKSTRLNSSH